MATTKRKRKGYVDPHVFITDVESITLRDFNGDGSQAELMVRTRTGTLYLRLIARKGAKPRLIDMRASDRKRHRKTTTFSGVELRGGLVPVMTSEDAERRAVAREAARDAREDR